MSTQPYQSRKQPSVSIQLFQLFLHDNPKLLPLGQRLRKMDNPPSPRSISRLKHEREDSIASYSFKIPSQYRQYVDSNEFAQLHQPNPSPPPDKEEYDWDILKFTDHKAELEHEMEVLAQVEEINELGKELGIPGEFKAVGYGKWKDLELPEDQIVRPTPESKTRKERLAGRNYPSLDELPPLPILKSSLTQSPDAEELAAATEQYGLVGSDDDKRSFLRIINTIENQSKIDSIGLDPALVQAIHGKPPQELTLEDLNHFESDFRKFDLDALGDLEGLIPLVKEKLNPLNAPDLPSKQFRENFRKETADRDRRQQTAPPEASHSRGDDEARISITGETAIYNDLLKQIDSFNKKNYPTTSPIDPKTGKLNVDKAYNNMLRHITVGDELGPIPQQYIDEGLDEYFADADRGREARDPNTNIGLVGNPKYFSRETVSRLGDIMELLERQREEIRQETRRSLRQDSQEYLQFQEMDKMFEQRQQLLKRQSLSDNAQDVFRTLTSRKESIIGQKMPRFPLTNEPIPTLSADGYDDIPFFSPPQNNFR